MKKLLLFAIAVLFAMGSVAQNRATLLQESFDGSTMPSGWSIAGMGTSNWSISNTQHAGGVANELMLYYNPSFNGTSRFVSPAMDLTGVSSIVVSFKHALDNYSGAHTLGIATTSDGGTTWNEGWTTSIATSGNWEESHTISTSDMGHANVQFCIYYTGNSYNINNWYFDDIIVFTLENLDLGLTSTSMPDFIGSGNCTMDMTVFNFGTTTVTSVEATYAITGKDPVTETFPVNIASLGNATLTFTEPAMFIPGSYEVTFSIDKVNGTDDDIADNNTMVKTISVALSSAERIPMIEHFSSSTCGPCVSVNTQMLNFCNNNPGRFTYTKYQMNWPGSGDPYYTNEGGTRRTYYGVSAVPQCFLDGEDQGYAAVQQTVFNQHAERTAFMDIRGSFSVDGNNIHVLVDVMPYVDANARLFVSVNEKETHGNVGSNGETSFHHVFMKMLPDAQGTAIDFVANELQHMEFTQDMSGTHVEEMSDLEVSIWVQNYSTHEILNSRFAYEYTDVHPYPVENLDLAMNNESLVASWDEPANGTPSGYDVYINGDLVANAIAETQYTYSGGIGDFNFVEVVALYPSDMTSVKVATSIEGTAADMGLVVVGEQEVVMDLDNPSAVVTVTNGNYVSLNTLQVMEVVVADPQYLEATPQNDLPYSLEPNESFEIRLDPSVVVKGVVNTTVTVVSDNGEAVFSVQIDGELLCVTELTSETQLYPNPTNGNFVVEGAHMAGVEVYNLVGQKVFEAQGNLVNVDAANWEKGLYLVSVKNQNGSVETHKLMVK